MTQRTSRPWRTFSITSRWPGRNRSRSKRSWSVRSRSTALSETPIGADPPPPDRLHYRMYGCRPRGGDVASGPPRWDSARLFRIPGRAEEVVPTRRLERPKEQDGGWPAGDHNPNPSTGRALLLHITL